MPRIVGVDIPEKKRIEVALTYIVGIGRANVKKILARAKVNPDTRTKNLTDNEFTRLQKIIDTYLTEGSVKSKVRDSIQRLKRIGSYRGLRHSQGLPVRGQKTRTNARTNRGKRKTVGAMKKKDLTKFQGKTVNKGEEGK